MEDDPNLQWSVAEQIAFMRRQWAESRYFQLTPPARPEQNIHVVRMLDDSVQHVIARTQEADGSVTITTEEIVMPPQEDEITLLDEGDVRAVNRTPIRLADNEVLPTWDPVSVIDEVPFVSTGTAADFIVGDDVHEISMSQAATAPKKRKAAVKAAPQEIKEIVRPPLYGGNMVYAQGQQLYTTNGGRIRNFAYASFGYVAISFAHVEAVSMMMGNTLVLCATKADLAKFKALLEKVTITVAEGKTLCFFTGTEFVCDGPDIVVIVFDGETIRYGGRNADERIMKLSNPICQKSEKIFTALTSFAVKSTDGANSDIKHQKDMLAHLAERNAEEAYLYIQEITPPTERAAIHARILADLEQVYATDQRAMTTARAMLTMAMAKIEKAKSQIPSGRKGVPLRNSYLTSPVLPRLLDYFKIIRDGYRLKTIFVFKQDLVVEGIEYGRPEITINMDARESAGRRGGTFILESCGVTVRSADKQAFMHPHIENDRRWCMGTYIGPVNNAIMGGNIPVAASLIWEYLSRYNPESPLIRIDTCRDQMAAARPRDLIIRRK